jgi:predicted secreted protein
LIRLKEGERLAKGAFLFRKPFIALLIAACLYGTSALGNLMAAQVCEPMLHLSEGDNGRTLELRTGESIEIVLPENASTGYRWAIDHYDKKLLEAVAMTPEYTGQAMGSGGAVVFLFRAQGSGAGEIVLKNWRHWEGEASVTRRFRLNLTIRPELP